MKELSVGCVVLAAGNASRFGSNKLSATVGGKTLLERALSVVPRERLREAVVVTQYGAAAETAERMGFAVVRNDRPEDGLSRSVRLGTERIMSTCDGALYLVADQPLLRRESVERLIELWLAQPERIAALAHGGVRGNPCLFPAAYFPELCALTGDVGGSAVIRRHEAELVLLETDGRELRDVDTPEALSDL